MAPPRPPIARRSLIVPTEALQKRRFRGTGRMWLRTGAQVACCRSTPWRRTRRPSRRARTSSSVTSSPPKTGAPCVRPAFLFEILNATWCGVVCRCLWFPFPFSPFLGTACVNGGNHSGLFPIISLPTRQDAASFLDTCFCWSVSLRTSVRWFDSPTQIKIPCIEQAITQLNDFHRSLWIRAVLRALSGFDTVRSRHSRL
jgi:hypothetical protein